MTALEIKILDALQVEKERLAKYDDYLKSLYDKYMEKAEQSDEEYWKKDCKRSAEFHLSGQKHGYNFLTDWKNVISSAMYGRIYFQWHSAQAGRYKGTGHGAYVTTELTEKEISNIDKVFNGLVRHGYLKLSKSGKMAKYTK